MLSSEFFVGILPGMFSSIIIWSGIRHRISQRAGKLRIGLGSCAPQACSHTLGVQSASVVVRLASKLAMRTRRRDGKRREQDSEEDGQEDGGRYDASKY